MSSKKTNAISFDISGAIDLHVHCGPEGIPRRFNPVSLAEHVGESQLDSVVMKSHVISTSSWAQLAHQLTGVRLHGSIVLNHYVGGINASAVRGALGPRDDLGPYLKVVWLPTVHAATHVAALKRQGEKFDIPPEWSGGTISSLAVPLEDVEPINLLSPTTQGRLDELLQLIAEYDLILATGHVGRDEVFHVVERAMKHGIRRIIATHPLLDPPGLTLSDLSRLADMGVFTELCYMGIDLGAITLQETANVIQQVGVSRTVLSTDFGQIDRVPPDEGLALFGNGLVEAGVTSNDILIAVKDNPLRLLSRNADL